MKKLISVILTDNQKYEIISSRIDKMSDRDLNKIITNQKGVKCFGTVLDTNTKRKNNKIICWK